MEPELIRTLVVVGACVASAVLGSAAPSLVAWRLDKQNQQLRYWLQESDEKARKLKLALDVERFHGKKTQALPPRGE